MSLMHDFEHLPISSKNLARRECKAKTHESMTKTKRKT